MKTSMLSHGESRSVLTLRGRVPLPTPVVSGEGTRKVTRGRSLCASGCERKLGPSSIGTLWQRDRPNTGSWSQGRNLVSQCQILGLLPQNPILKLHSCGACTLSKFKVTTALCMDRGPALSL